MNFPNLTLLLTGGHTQIYLVKSIGEYKLLGETVDDAIGESFDKVAKLLVSCSVLLKIAQERFLRYFLNQKLVFT
mgnify:CR=1 FL=1